MDWDRDFVKEWRLKWTEGVVLGFIRNRIERARAFGMLRKAKSMGVTNNELKAILQAIENSPVYLPTLNQNEKIAKIKEIREAIIMGEL